MNIENGITVDKVAGYFGVCRKKIQTEFRAQYGISPGEYIRKRKLTRAAIILRMTKAGVAEIAQILHYSSHQNFIRAFRAFFGVTPGQYRAEKETCFTGVQLPVSMAGIPVQEACIVYRESVFIKGHRISLTTPLYTPEYIPEDDVFFQSLQKSTGECDCMIYQVSSFMLLLEKVNNHVAVRTMTGCACQDVFSVDSHCIPAGYYARFSFQGTWQNFRLFSQKIYTANLKSLGWRLRWGYHVNIFDVSGGVDENLLSGECLIPVEIIV